MLHLTPTIQLWLTLGLFVVTFIGIFTEVVHKEILAGVGAALCVLLGLATEGEAGGFVDFQTLSLLIGMMTLVSVASMAGLFEYVSVKILKATGGMPLMIFALFMLFTLLLSSFLNNVTTVLIMIPLSIQIARGIGLNPRPFVLGEIFFANIGGLLTLIGDPVNTIIGSAAGLGMVDFMINLSIPVFIVFIATMIYLYVLNKAEFKPISDHFGKMLHNLLVIRRIEDQLKSKDLNASYMIGSASMLVVAILAMIFSDKIGFSAGTIALLGAMVTLLLNHKHINLHRLFGEIEWGTLFFYIGLFVLVGTVEKTGVLESLANLLEVYASNPYVLLALLLLLTGVVSAFVDNIPFVTIMIPVIKALQEGPLFPNNPEMLWWALAMGAVLGGMASPFGSSANIVAIGIAQKNGFKVATPYYLRYSLFVSSFGLIVSYLYLILAYEF